MYTYSNCQEFLTYPDTYYYWKPKNSYTTTYYNGYFQNGKKSSLFLDWASERDKYVGSLPEPGEKEDYYRWKSEKVLAEKSDDIEKVMEE